MYLRIALPDPDAERLQELALCEHRRVTDQAEYLLLRALREHEQNGSAQQEAALSEREGRK